jgi:hypothetical protein
MSTVTSYLTRISINGKYLQYIPTNTFSINSLQCKGVIITSNSPSTFIVTQRMDTTLFHNIQTNETQYLVMVNGTINLPAEISLLIGGNIPFLTTTNVLIPWFFVSTPVASTQSNINLLNQTNGVYITNTSNKFWSLVNNKISLALSGNTFSFDQITNSNIIIGSKTVSGGSGSIDLVPVVNGTFFIPFSPIDSGTVTELNTDAALEYNATKNALIVDIVSCNKIGRGSPTNGDSTYIMGDDAGNGCTATDSIGLGNNSLRNSSGEYLVGVGFNSLRSNTGDDSIGIGRNAGQQNTGNSIIAIGKNAAHNGGINSGNNIIAIGENTLANGNIGHDNIAIGANSLAVNTSGTENLAIGINALNSITSGTTIVAIGNNAGSAIITGADNVAIGKNAFANTSTNLSNSIAIGRDAGQFNTFDTGHVFIGNVSGRTNEGQNITAVGGSSAEQNTGNFVSAFGASACSINTGDHTIGVGQNSAYENSGNDLIAIGRDAGSANTGEFVIAIGHETASLNTGNNIIAIGDGVLSINQGVNNIGIGGNSLASITAGANNIAIGLNSGSLYTGNESNNIIFGGNGYTGDSNIVRLGNNTHTYVNVESPFVFTSAAVTHNGTITLTPADIIPKISGGIILKDVAGMITYTLPDAADINTALGVNIQNGYTFSFMISNSSVDTITLASGSDVNIIGPATILGGTSRVIYVNKLGVVWNVY